MQRRTLLTPRRGTVSSRYATYVTLMYVLCFNVLALEVDRACIPGATLLRLPVRSFTSLPMATVFCPEWYGSYIAMPGFSIGRLVWPNGSVILGL